MVLLQQLHIHTGSVVIALRKAFANDLRKVGIAHIVFCQKHQMIIAVLTARQFSVKAGMGCHIDLTADDRIDPRLLRRLIKIDRAVHHAMIRDGGTVHSQLLHIFHIFFDLIGTVQETELRVDVEMRKCHI